MSILNQYILNRAYPEGSMIEGYNTEEVIEYWLGYLNDKVSIDLSVPLHSPISLILLLDERDVI